MQQPQTNGKQTNASDHMINTVDVISEFVAEPDVVGDVFDAMAETVHSATLQLGDTASACLEFVGDVLSGMFS